MGKIFLFIFDEMTDYEVTLVLHLLNTVASKKIVPIAYEHKIIRGRSGLSYQPERLVREVLPEQAEGLIIPGGWQGETRAELLALIAGMSEEKKLLAGICGAGTVYLAKAGVLEQVRYTTPAVEWTLKHQEIFGEEDPFPRQHFVDERLVRDGHVITAQGIAFIDFAVEICDWFHVFSNEAEKIDLLYQIRRR